MSNTTTYQYTMKFNADTSAAKKQIEDLQSSLDRLISGTGTAKDLPITQSLAAAQSKAAELRVALEGATNVNTGKLDLSKFAESLARNGTSLEQYRQSLNKLGPEGQTAFLRLSTAISQAEVPLKRTSTLMTNFANTMKNAVKWQLSSSLIHGFMSSLSTAWNYAQDLNESLNNIRIVTGYNVDQMSAFADQANRAAKALSTTTTSYTDASLIYYQQGLSDKEVQARTNTTIKLANVSGQSVDESAEQLTSIWNNYAEGADNLEYYADVLVKLGAATASSSEEIATGLSKFAATGETVGLSYEYAASALATITATTRESADTVGTALKTLFARIQDLEQGQTLDDGTTLGQYSEALNKVGVNIKTVTGEVKDMDVILDEVGEKWGTMSKDAQIALAQNVAGVRQYTQFMALMNNYDFFKENVATAENSSGELEVQQEIYAESWEAASNRVQASLETIYAALLDDEFFISLTNGVASFTDALGGVIEKAGGLKGVVAMLSPLLFKLFGSELATGIDNIIYRITNLGNTTSKMVEKLKAENTTAQKNTGKDVGDNSEYVMANAWSGVEKTQSAMLMRSKELTAEKKQQLQIEQNIIADQAEQLIQDAHRLETLEAQTEYLKEQAASGIQSAQESHVSSDNYFTNDGKKNARFKTKGSVYSRNDLTDEEKLNELNQAEALNLSRQKLIQQKGEEGQYPQDRKELENIKTNLETIKKLKAEIAIKGLFSSEEIKNGETLMSKYEESLKAQKSLQKINSDIQKKGISSETGTQYSKEDIASLKEYVNQVKAMPGVVGEAETAVNALDEALQTGDSEKIQQALEGLGTSSQEAKKKAEDLSGKIQNLVNDLRAMGKNEAADALQEFADSAKVTSDEIQLTGGHVANFQTKIQNFLNEVGKAPTRTLSLGESLSALGSTCTAVASMINTVSSAINTFQDESSTTGEKALALVQAFGFGLMSLTSLMNDNNKILLQRINNQFLMNAAESLGIATTGEAAVSSLADAAAKLIEAGAVKTTAGAYATLVANMLLSVAPMILIIGLIGAMVALIYASRGESNLEQLSKQAELLEENLTLVKNKIDELENSISSLDSAYESLESLTKGTLEWRQAVADINEEVMSLIETFPELVSYLSNEEGILKIDPEGLEKAQESLLQQQNSIQAASYLNEAKILQESNKRTLVSESAEILTDDLNSDEKFRNSKIQQYLEDASGGYSNKLINSIFDAINSGAISAASSAEEIKSALSLVGTDSEALAQSIAKNIDSLTKKANQLNILEKESQVLTNQAVSAKINDTDAYQGSVNQEALSSSLKGALDAEISSLHSEMVRESGTTFWTGEIKYNEDLAKQYIESIYGGQYTMDQLDAKEAVFGQDLKYKDPETGNTVKVSMTDIINYLSNIEAKLSDEDVAEQEKQNRDIVNQGDSVANGFGQQLLNFKTGVTDSFDLMDIAQADLSKIESEQGNFGLSNSSQKLLQGAIDEANAALEGVSEGLSTAVQEVFEGLDSENLSKMSANEQKELGQTLEKAYASQGQAGLDIVSNLFNSLSGDVGSFNNIINNLDWTSSGEDLKNALEEVGIQSSLTADELQVFIDKIKGVSEAVSHEEASEYHNLLEGVRESVANGEGIDVETYDSLDEYLKNMFTYAAEGVYVFEGQVEDLYSYIDNHSLDGFKNNIEYYRSELQDLRVLGRYSDEDFSRLQKSSVVTDPAGKEKSRNEDLFFDQMDFLSLIKNSLDGEDQNTVTEVANKIEQGDEVTTEEIRAINEILSNYFEQNNVSKDSINEEKTNVENALAEEEKTYALATRETPSSLSELRASTDFHNYDMDMSDPNWSLENAHLEYLEWADAVAHYSENVQILASEYENATDELSAYQAALIYGSEEEQALAAIELERAIAAGEAAGAYGLEAEELDALGDYFAELAESGDEAYKTLYALDGTLNTDAITDAAVRYKRLNNAVEDLHDNYDDYSDILSKIQKAENKNEKILLSSSDTYKNLRKSLADLLNTSEDFIDLDFVDALDPDDFQSAAEGNEDAIRRIRDAFAEAQAEAYGIGDMAEQLKAELAGISEGQTLDIDNTPALQALIEAAVAAGASASDIESMLSGLSIDCDNVEFLNAMGEVIDASDEAVQAGSIDAEAQTVTVNNTDTKQDIGFDEDIFPGSPVTANDAILESSGANLRHVTQHLTPFSKTVTARVEEEDALKQDSVTAVRLSNAHGSAGGKVATSNKSTTGNTGGSGGSGGGGGGGGSSSPAKKVQKTKFTDLGDRYHTITKQIDNQARATEKLSKLEDRLYGAAKLKAMKEQSQELLKQTGLLEKKRKEAEAYLVEDTKELENQIANWNSTYGTNLKVEYGEDGEILNYREIIEAIQGTTNAWEDKLNSYSTQEEQDSDENQQYTEDLENNTAAVTDAIAQYEETQDTLNEIDDAIEDAIDEIQSLNFETWSYKLELVGNKLDRLTALLDRTNKILGLGADNIYTGAAYAKNQMKNMDNIDDTIQAIIGKKAYAAGYDNMWDFEESFEEMVADKTNSYGDLYSKYQSGEINQAQFVEGLQTLMDELGEAGESLVDIIEEGSEFFANQLADAQERIEFFANQIADASSEIDHYTNLLDLVGREQDYETKGQLLAAQGQVKTDQVNSAKSTMDLMKEQYDWAQSYYDSLTTQAEKDAFQETLDSAYSAWIESQEDYLTACEEYAEVMKSIAENELALVNQKVTEAVLGKDKSWDAVNDQLDRYSSVGEEYLTNTNKIYEITKLTRDIQSKIDSTSNTAAQQRLATFKKQTEELGKQEGLTEYELELQNKKYELLQAEIAMEEAQNAKSQVRLTRDSEGNYSYTYTADEDTVQSAEDEYLEKQNALYNYALEGSNDYYTKYVQTTQAYQEAMSELQLAWLSGEIATQEEYDRRKAEIQQYYGNQLITYANLYNLSMDTLNDNAVDSWTTQQGLIISTTLDTGSTLEEETGNIVGNLSGHLDTVMKAYGNTMTNATGSMNQLKENTKNILLDGEGSISSIWDEGEDAVENYQKAISGAESPIKTVLENIALKAEDAANRATSAAKNIDTLTNSLQIQLESVRNVTEEWLKYGQKLEHVRDMLVSILELTEEEIEQQEKEDPVEVTPEVPAEEVAEESPSGEEEAMPKDNVTFDMVREIYDKINTGKWKGTYGWANRRQRAIDEGYPPEAYEIAQEVINDTYTIPNRGNASYLGQIDEAIKHELEKAGYTFDTGGYTGEWGAEGRLALLHQKELVLNAADTQNMLSMVEIVRDLIHTLDLNAISSTLGGINALTAGWNNFNTEKDALEQEIHIEANFPNATDRNEIIEAFSGLADLAAQYAGRQ